MKKRLRQGHTRWRLHSWSRDSDKGKLKVVPCYVLRIADGLVTFRCDGLVHRIHISRFLSDTYKTQRQASSFMRFFSGEISYLTVKKTPVSFFVWCSPRKSTVKSRPPNKEVSRRRHIRNLYSTVERF